MLWNQAQEGRRAVYRGWNQWGGTRLAGLGEEVIGGRGGVEINAGYSFAPVIWPPVPIDQPGKSNERQRLARLAGPERGCGCACWARERLWLFFFFFFFLAAAAEKGLAGFVHRFIVCCQADSIC